jgi:2,3-bisphosphoglycerate-independent phosphoglycerate mutase
MLAILDGWGINASEYGNAVLQADTPNFDRLFAQHPHTTLRTSGRAVGLPESQMGNSEVGHLNIGAGRVVYQSLTRITKSIEDGDFFENPALLRAVENAAQRQTALHIMGLIGPGGVHSHSDHLIALLTLAQRHSIKDVYIHAWLDGRDTPPRSADGYLKEIEDQTRALGIGRIATIAGRYYAMDRDKRWERIQQTYDALTLGNGRRAGTAAEAIQQAYARGENDEFVLPTNIGDFPEEDPITIGDGDSVIFFNFRPDRARQLTRCFVDPDFDGFVRTAYPKGLVFVTMTEFEKTLPNVLVAYPPEEIVNTLGAYISKLGLSQLRIAETEKYAHVTFFFNGQVEAPYPGEERILIPSPKVATYDLQPEMSAYAVCEKVLKGIDSAKYDLIILNFANMDMVGHTGILKAAVAAVETIDRCIGQIVNKITDVGGQILITADHGNSETMLTEAGEPVTAHSLNPVPLLFVRDDDAQFRLADGGALSDLAPTLLDMMALPIPAEMSGHSLLIR